MGYIDITKAIYTGMKKYPTDPAVEIRPFKSLKKGSSCNMLVLSFGSHTGTHIDAPCHILKRAKPLDGIRIEDLICKVAVRDRKKPLSGDFFKKAKKRKIKGVLLKGKKPLTLGEANIMVKNGMRLVGTESMSIESSRDKTHPVHHLLLRKGIIIIENIDLKKAKPGIYRLICLPLRLKGADGAPCRAVLAHD